MKNPMGGVGEAVHVQVQAATTTAAGAGPREGTYERRRCAEIEPHGPKAATTHTADALVPAWNGCWRARSGVRRRAGARGSPKVNGGWVRL
jgi:hypothetical protein